VSLLLDAGKAINSVLDLSAVLETILRSAIDLLGGTSGSIMLAEGDELVSSSVQGNDLARGRRIPIGDGIAGHVARSREPLLIDGDASAEDFPGLAPRDTPIESAISVPLVNRDELLGVLNVNAAVGRTFTEYDLRAMSVFAEQAAAAIANARLYEAEREHVAELIELDQMKRDFLDLMTHELRTPITSVLAAVEIAGRPGMEAERDEMHEIIARQGRRLDDMVGSLLMAARLERTETPQSMVVVDVAELARLITEHRVTALILATALFDLMQQHQPEVLAQVTQVVAGGDVMPVHRARERLAAGGPLINSYGPPEVTTVPTRPRGLDVCTV